MMEKKKIISDVIFSLIGSFFITGVSQLIVYPSLGEKLNSSSFGNMLTLMGISNAIGVIIGNSLNNIKLIKNNEYVEKEIEGDFKYLLRKSIIIAVIISWGAREIFFREEIEINMLINLILTTILVIYRCYLTVYYRISLQYNMILKHMIVTGIGYLIGLGIFYILDDWTIVFLTGEIVSVIYVLKTTKYRSESSKKTELYEDIKTDFKQLMISNSFVNLLLYADRLLINPILGAENGALYYIASISGKVFGVILQPVSSVILTYIAKVKILNKKRVFLFNVLFVFFAGVCFYFIIIKITPIILFTIYKDLASEALKYSMLANLALIIMVMGSLIQPFTLKFTPIKYQMIIQGIYGSIYLSLSLMMMKSAGLFGFCISAIIANSIRLCLFVLVGYVYIKE